MNTDDETMTDDREIHVHIHEDTTSEEQRDGRQASSDSGVLSDEEGMNAGEASLSVQDLEEGPGVGSTLDEGIPASADAATARNAGSAPNEVRELAQRSRSHSPESRSEIRLEDLTR